MITASEAREKLELVIQQTKENVSTKTLEYCHTLNPLIEEAIGLNRNMICITVPAEVSRKEVWDFLEQMGYIVSGVRAFNNKELRICW